MLGRPSTRSTHFCRTSHSCSHARREPLPPVDPEPVLRGLKAGQDGRVGRERLGAAREGLLEDRATGGQPVERRREGVPITVAAEVVGARGVERDEEGVGFARGSRLRLSAPTAGREEGQAQAKAPAYTAAQLRDGINLAADYIAVVPLDGDWTASSTVRTAVRYRLSGLQ